MLQVRKEGDKGEFALRSEGKTDLQMHDAHGLCKPGGSFGSRYSLLDYRILASSGLPSKQH